MYQLPYFSVRWILGKLSAIPFKAVIVTSEKVRQNELTLLKKNTTLLGDSNILILSNCTANLV